MRGHLGLTAAEFRRLKVPRAKARAHRPGEMNAGEKRYAAEVLELRRLAGEVSRYDFEALKLRLGSRTFYTPDFMVTRADGGIELVDVKGRKGERYWAMEDATVKVKVAAQAFPQFQFRIAWPAKAGGWSHRDL